MIVNLHVLNRVRKNIYVKYTTYCFYPLSTKIYLKDNQPLSTKYNFQHLGTKSTKKIITLKELIIIFVSY